MYLQTTESWVGPDIEVWFGDTARYRKLGWTRDWSFVWWSQTDKYVKKLCTHGDHK